MSAPDIAGAYSNRETTESPPGLFWKAGLFFVIALAVMLGLLGTVHNRDINTLVTEKENSQLRMGRRYDEAIQRWLDKGFFHEGGMIFFNKEMSRAFWPHAIPEDSQIKSDTVFAYAHSTGSWIIPAYLMQRVIKAFTGKFSERAMFIYNLSAVAIASALLALLAMQISSSMGLRPIYCFTLGCACLLVYQTFPLNLWNFWEVAPFIFPVIGSLLFLNHEYARWHRDDTPGRQALRSFLAFLLIFSEPMAGGLFISFYLLMRALTDKDGVHVRDVVLLLVIPSILVLSYIYAQQILVRSNYESVFFVGSTLSSRMGLDGNTSVYRDHWDLLIRGWVKWQPLAGLLSWPTLFVLGSVSLIALLPRYGQLPALREPLKIIIATIGLYIPSAIVLSQSVVVHPYSYDLYLAIPCILALICLLPTYLERYVWPTGLVILFAAIASAGYTFAQLRIFAAAFPTG